jgi:hypothetical protein
MPDRKSQDFGQELYIRELRYAVHLNLQDVFEAKTLEDVTISASMRHGGELATFDVNNDGQ